MRIVEQALRDIPGGPIQVDPEGRHADTGAEIVDRAKQGKTEGLRRQMSAVTDPTLEGSAKPLHLHIASREKRVSLPPKEATYGSIEGLMKHFMLVMDGYGIRPPAGEVYFPVEGANGELGFYVVSDGSDRPYRVRCPAAVLCHHVGAARILVGDMIADLTPTFGSVNMIGGELDR